MADYLFLQFIGAIETLNLPVVKDILDKKPNFLWKKLPGKRNILLYTLMEAVEGKNMKILRHLLLHLEPLLLKKEQSAIDLINQRDTNGGTLLHYMVTQTTRLSGKAFFEVEELFKLLLAAKADPNIGDDIGNTPAHSAIITGNIHFLGLLIEYGANPLVANKMGQLPYDLAEDFGDTTSQEILRPLTNFADIYGEPNL